MAEASIASAIAAPYTYKVESNEWILRSETYARIELLGDNTRTQFRIVVLGQVEGRVEVIVNLSLFKEIIYHRSSGLFHQFADKTSLVGLRFPSEEDAARFAASFENVINLLNNPQPNTPLPMPSGYPPTPPVSASMPVSSPLAAGNSFPSSHVDSVFSSSPTPLRTPIQRRDSSSGGDASAFHAGAVTAESRSQLGGRKPLLGANRDVADASPTTPDVGSPPEPQTAAVGKTFVRTTSSTGSSNALLASNPSMRSPSPAVAKVQVSAPKTGASPRAAPALLKASAVPVTPNPEMKLRPSLTGSLPPPPEEFATAPVPPPPVAVVDPAPPALSPLRASPLTDTSSSTMSSLSSDSPLRSSVQSFSSQSFASPNGGSPIASAVSAPANVSPRGTPAAVTPLSPKSVSIAPSAKATPSKPPPLLVPKTAPTTAPAPAPVVTLPPAALTSPSAPQLGTLRHGAQAPSPQTTTIRRNVDQNILTLGLTPGTSAAMEKLEAAEEQTRHRLKIDLSDPRWKAATLFVQLMIECSEQLFPNKGRFVLSTMPKLIKRSLEYLETEAALVENVFLYEYLEKLERLDRLKAYIDKDQDLTKASREQTVHLIAELVKRHCRDIPGQLINLEAYDPTYSFCDMPDDASRLQYIQELVDTLPATSKVVLECVITLLARVHAASSVTKMDAMRLGAVFAPLLLRPQLLEYKRPQPIPLSVRLEL